MSDELFDEGALRRALRLDADERVHLDVRALAAEGAAREHERVARLFLGGLALASVVPAIALVRLTAALVGDPALLGDPAALAAVAALPLAEGLVVLAQPATALATVAAVAILTLFQRRETVRATAS
ncbi:MAG TPA: hypothetical protein VFM93_01795 [Candidatus Limnocylindria bacterium]|nr:hypothetical protein [Candidatus Limnocylindria bacterium]